MKYLLIAEKPSLMREIQSCYKKHQAKVESVVGMIDFIALSGHICTNCLPNEYAEWAESKWGEIPYPMVPSVWKIKPIEDERKKKLLEKIRNLIPHYDGIIVATDSDVEGYGIYYLLETYLHLGEKKALRFIEHSLTDKEILDSLLSMTDYHKDPTHTHATQSFLIRSRADWLFGMNATQIMSSRKGELLRIGRVKAPTIKLVYDNSIAIAQFVPRKYYQLQADYGQFQALLCDEKGSPQAFESPDKCGSYPLEGVVQSIEKNRTYVHAPKLFDLTSAQAEAGRVFGYTPSQTLEIIQSLYEKHKVISYPRTQCRYVSSEKAKEFGIMLGNMSAFSDLSRIAENIAMPDIQRVLTDKNVVNDGEVQKESHDALLPTANRPILAKMTEEERNVCHMIYTRLLAQFLPKVAEDKTRFVILHGTGSFIANGKTVVEQGWRILYKASRDTFLPPLKEGQEITALQIAPVEKVTTPPKRLTQATLINAMQNIANMIQDKELRKSLADSQGIGTPATRAATISEIIKSGYIEDRKGGLYITDLGKTYVESLDGIGIIKPEFAAVIDTQIKKVQRGEAEFNSVYRTILQSLQDMCVEMEKTKKVSRSEGEQNSQLEAKCPICGANLIKQKFSYLCSGNCGFKLGRVVCGKSIDERLLSVLLAGEKTPAFLLKKKDGTSFHARLYLEKGELKFDFSSGIRCPVCKKNDIRLNRGGAFCDCGFKLYRKTAGKQLTDTEMKQLLTKGKTKKAVAGLKKKNGDTFSAILLMDEQGNISFKFD